MDSFPILSTITYLPLLGALVIFFMPHATRETSRLVALIASSLSLIASIAMLVAFKHNDTFQFTEHKTWLKDLGVSYFMGVDGIAVLLIVLTTILVTISIIYSWDSINVRTREYYIAILLLETGMLGVFMSLDLFLFYIFWELMLIPMALLIGIWGHENRVYAAVKFFLYTLFGSLLMLVAIVAMYQSYYNETGTHTLNILTLQSGHYGHTFQIWVFAAFFLAFAVKVPMFPVHTWLPDAHVQAPTAGSVILAAVMLKMGGYGMLRFNLPLFPEGTNYWRTFVIVLSVIAIIYGAFVSLVQSDWKKLIAYSSVSHMGFVTLGIFIHNIQGMDGSMMVMLAHGFNTGALFLIVGMAYERAHTLRINAFGGLATPMPVWSAFFVLFAFASIGLPGLSGFVGEFLVTIGTWHYNKIAAIITFCVVIIAAWYLLWLVQRVVFGRTIHQLPEPGDSALTPAERAQLAEIGDHGHGPVPHLVSGGAHEAHPVPAEGQLDSSNWPDLSIKELICLVPLTVLTILTGVYPKPVFDIADPSFHAILNGAMRVIGN